MQVTLFRDLVQEQWTSIEVYANRLADGLRRLGMAGWEFRDVCPIGVRLPRVRVPTLYFNRTVIYGLFALAHQSPLNHVLDNSYGHLLHLINPRRAVVTSHGGTPLTWRRWNREGPAMRFFDWTFAGAVKAAHMIFVSNSAKREVVDHYGYDPAHAHVVHHGIDEAYRRLGDEAVASIRARYLQPSECGLILHVGHCAARKNLEGLLCAFAELRRQSDEPYRLLQIGGQFSPEQRRLIDRLGVSPYVTQIAQIPNAQLAAFYNAADLFVFPSLYEGFGIPLIEAMACGTPIVCTEYDLFHEVCADAAAYADTQNTPAFAAQMARVLNDASLAADLRQRGLERAKQFTWEQCAQKTFAVYRQLAEELS